VEEVAQWLQLVMGPLGALAVSLAVGSLALRELHRRHQVEVARFEAQVEYQRDQLAEMTASLKDANSQRIADAAATTQTLMLLNDRIHETVDHLSEMKDRSQVPP